MNFREIRNAADPYVELLEDGSGVVIRSGAFEALDDCMDDAEFGNVVRFSLMLARIFGEDGACPGVRIGESMAETGKKLDDAMAGRETTKRERR